MLDKILSSSLECYRTTVRFYPADDVCLDAWIGAVFRNRFLYFADSVCDESGTSLRECLDELPLSQGHSYYNQMKGGFPKGVFFDFREIPARCRKGNLCQNTIYTFYVVFIGTAVSRFPMVVQTLENMFADGVGHPQIPLSLVDIVEQDSDGENRLLYSGNSTFINMPENPVRISDYETDIDDYADVRLTFDTPTSLYQLKEKVQPELSYQHKMNGFPSFYQLVRSVTYRWATLSMLYGDFPDVGIKELEKKVDEFVELSSLAILDEASLRRRKIHGTPKKEASQVYVMEGYEGEMTFRRVSCRYLPLLIWGMYAAVGNNVQYGMGNYSIEVNPRQ